MNKTHISRLLVFALILALASPFMVSAQEEGPVSHRYFVKTEKGIWKKTLNARHVFKGGFTADLSAIQLNIAKFMGIETQRLPAYQISPLFNSDVSEADVDKLGVVTKRATPDKQIPANIRLINPSIESLASSNSVPKEEAVKVAVLDTGISSNHPDLKNLVSDCRDFTSFNLTSISDRCTDKNGHGTAVSSIISSNGGDDSNGMFGVNPRSALAVYKVCDDSGICYGDDIAYAIRTAVSENIRIINLSLGSDSGEDFVLKEAIDFAVKKGVIVLSSAGNDGPDKKSLDYPASFSGVISIGAIDADLAVTDWSSRGLAPSVVSDSDLDVNFVAPGNKIQVANLQSGYSYLSGTSLSAPHIAGLVSLIIQDNPDISSDEIRSHLIENSIDIDKKGPDSNTGFGIPVYKK